MSTRRLLLAAIGVLSLVSQASAQSYSELDGDSAGPDQSQQQVMRRQTEETAPGRVAESAVGRAGQRQTREEAAPGINPTARISNRINNRVQSRIRNRIDRDYDPQANARSPFAVAEDEARSAARRSGR